MWRWQFQHGLLQVEKSAVHIRTALKGVIKPVCAQRYWMFTEVKLQRRCNRMHVHKRLQTSIKRVWYMTLIKITSVKIRIIIINITNQSLSNYQNIQNNAS
jgi:hypothetical protein